MFHSVREEPGEPQKIELGALHQRGHQGGEQAIVELVSQVGMGNRDDSRES